MRGVLVALILLLAPVQASAQTDYNRSDTWLELCQLKTSECSFYIMGIVQGAKFTREFLSLLLYDLPAGKLFINVSKNKLVGCLKDAPISIGQMRKIWTQYLINNPQEHHLKPRQTFSLSMNKAFPCE